MKGGWKENTRRDGEASEKVIEMEGAKEKWRRGRERKWLKEVVCK